MIESLYADIGWQSLTKTGQIVCGDHVELSGPGEQCGPICE